MKTRNTALLLIGYQNDYFNPEGILHSAIEENSKITNITVNTIKLLNHLNEKPELPVIATPIIFSEDYREIDQEPVGILKIIKEKNAFIANRNGSEIIHELRAFGDRIHYISGKTSFNAFANTELHKFLHDAKIEHLVIAGVVTSICIDSTGRSAHERGFKVYILSDCTSARSTFEQEFFIRNIFPLYAEVLNHDQLIERLEI